MCGIIGQYNFKDKVKDQDFLYKCLQKMKYRGPDEQKTWSNDDHYFAGFARLAIRDMSANAGQPMLSKDGKFCICFNGEIYNTSYCKGLLKPFITEFHTTSDTEVFFYVLIHLGIEKTLEVVDGIFAFAFYDKTNNTLILARDKTGVKPLYYGVCSSGVVFSSEYAHIINHPFFKEKGYDASAIYHYLFLGYMPEGNAIIHGTYFLPHGHYLILKKGQPDLKQYYEFGKDHEFKDSPFDEVLEHSVVSQLVSDVPIGTFMSGGVDSTLVSYFANKHQHFKAFTLGILDSKMDESDAARSYAEKFHIPHCVTMMDAEELDKLIEEHISAFSEPFADYSSLPALKLSEFSKKYITVALSGDGGDELFWGYNRNIRALNLIRIYQKNKLYRKASLIGSKLRNKQSVEIKRHWHANDFQDYYYSTLGITGAHKWLPLLMREKPGKPFFFRKQLEQGDDFSHNMMQWMRNLEMDLHLPRILLKMDRASMYHSLEVRVPFLSNAMLQYSRSIDYQECIQNGVGKVNIKKSLAEKAGNHAAFEPKKGFGIPLDIWMRNNQSLKIRETISNMPERLQNMFNKKMVDKLLDAYFKDKEDIGWFIWALYMLVRWNQTYKC